MAKPFDATLKTLLETDPKSWLQLLESPSTNARLIDADVSTISGGADKVILVEGEPPWILHVDFQVSPETRLPERGCWYNGLIAHRHQLPVRTAIVLLRPAANLSNLTGTFDRRLPRSSEPYLTFHYDVLRVWQLDPKSLIKDGLGTLPLAPISNVTQEQLPGVIDSVKEVLDQCSSTQREDLWTATYVLMGLRYNDAVIEPLLQGVLAMEESVTYQAIIRKGEIKHGQKMLLRIGTKKFGAPSQTVESTIAAIQDPDRLELLGEQTVDAQSWEELLAEPT